jgi:hypothetical protein
LYENIVCACAYFSGSAKKSACRFINEKSGEEFGAAWTLGREGGKKY